MKAKRVSFVYDDKGHVKAKKDKNGKWLVINIPPTVLSFTKLPGYGPLGFDPISPNQ